MNEVMLSCDTCGYQTRRAHPGRAASYLRSHSCDRQLRAKALAEAWEAQRATWVERDCVHGGRHLHGSSGRYIQDGCRCEPCHRGQNRRVQQWRHRTYKRGLDMVDATGTVRRMQALAVIGWSYAEQARRLGVGRENHLEITRRSRVYRDKADAVKRLYDELSMRFPDPKTPAERISVTKSIAWAKSNGWVPPLAWDDDIDDPDAVPYGDVKGNDGIDEAAVYRRMNGERLPLTKPESAVVVQRLRWHGMSDHEIEKVTGLNPLRYAEHRRAAA